MHHLSIPPTPRILEIGGGIGGMVGHFIDQYGPISQAVFVDKSNLLLNFIAHEHHCGFPYTLHLADITQEGWTDRLSLELQSLNRMDLEHEDEQNRTNPTATEFDIILCTIVTELNPTKFKATARMIAHTFLAKGGIFFFSTKDSSITHGIWTLPDHEEIAKNFASIAEYEKNGTPLTKGAEVQRDFSFKQIQSSSVVLPCHEVFGDRFASFHGELTAEIGQGYTILGDSRKPYFHTNGDDCHQHEEFNERLLSKIKEMTEEWEKDGPLKGRQLQLIFNTLASTYYEEQFLSQDQRDALLQRCPLLKESGIGPYRPTLRLYYAVRKDGSEDGPMNRELAPLEQKLTGLGVEGST